MSKWLQKRGGVAPFQRAAPVLAVCDGKRAPGLAGRELVAALLAEFDRRHGRIALRETNTLLFPDGCPEPVLANDRFKEVNGVRLENEFRTVSEPPGREIFGMIRLRLTSLLPAENAFPLKEF